MAEYRRALEVEAAARGEAFQRNLPGEICRCLQGTLPRVRQAIEESDCQQFANEREAIAAILCSDPTRPRNDPQRPEPSTTKQATPYAA